MKLADAAHVIFKAHAPVRIFVSHAPEDEHFAASLAKHLITLQRNGLVEVWSASKILPGANVNDEPLRALDSAHVVLVLVSVDYLNAKTVWEGELQRALDRLASGEVQLVPILVRPVDLHGTPLAPLAPLPTPLPTGERTVTQWNNKEEAWLHIADSIRTLLEESPSGPRPAAPVQDPATRGPELDAIDGDGDDAPMVSAAAARTTTLSETECLAPLFVTLFNGRELIRFLRFGPHGDEVVTGLINTEELITLARSAVDSLIRLQLVNAALFDRLCRVRPDNTGEIRRVQARLQDAHRLSATPQHGEQAKRYHPLMSAVFATIILAFFAVLITIVLLLTSRDANGVHAWSTGSMIAGALVAWLVVFGTLLAASERIYRVMMNSSPPEVRRFIERIG